MSDERAFLTRLQEQPNDDAARMVYADWLEERDTPETTVKAEYLRTDMELAALPADDPTRPTVEEQLRLLALGVPVEWRRVVTSRVPSGTG